MVYKNQLIYSKGLWIRLKESEISQNPILGNYRYKGKKVVLHISRYTNNAAKDIYKTYIFENLGKFPFIWYATTFWSTKHKSFHNKILDN